MCINFAILAGTVSRVMSEIDVAIQLIFPYFSFSLSGDLVSVLLRAACPPWNSYWRSRKANRHRRCSATHVRSSFANRHTVVIHPVLYIHHRRWRHPSYHGYLVHLVTLVIESTNNPTSPFAMVTKISLWLSKILSLPYFKWKLCCSHQFVSIQ
jgi:hypothetical protein